MGRAATLKKLRKAARKETRKLWAGYLGSLWLAPVAERWRFARMVLFGKWSKAGREILEKEKRRAKPNKKGESQ